MSPRRVSSLPASDLHPAWIYARYICFKVPDSRASPYPFPPHCLVCRPSLSSSSSPRPPPLAPVVVSCIYEGRNVVGNVCGSYGPNKCSRPRPRDSQTGGKKRRGEKFGGRRTPVQFFPTFFFRVLNFLSKTSSFLPCRFPPLFLPFCRLETFNQRVSFLFSRGIPQFFSPIYLFLSTILIENFPGPMLFVVVFKFA